MIRLGVIGQGKRISTFINNSLRPESDEKLRVVGVVDPDEAGARSRLAPEDEDAQFYHSPKELMNKAGVDGVLVGTRCNIHTPIAIEMAPYDVPLFVEKPVAISLDQALALEAAFEDRPAPTVVSFPLRPSPLCRLTRSLIDDGAVGTPLHILATNYVSYGTTYWEQPYRNYEITGGLFLQKATHDFDYMMFLMGSPIVRVSATALYAGIFGGDKPGDLHCAVCDERHSCLESPGNRRRNGTTGRHDDHLCVFSAEAGTRETGTNEDASSALLEFASGAHGVYTQVFYARRDAGRRGAVVSGYHGTVDFDWYRNDVVRTRHHEPFTDRISAGTGVSHFGGDAELARNFIAVMAGRKEPVADMHAGLRSVYACLAARESAKTGTSQAVRQIGQG